LVALLHDLFLPDSSYAAIMPRSSSILIMSADNFWLQMDAAAWWTGLVRFTCLPGRA
jgi:hypothetical protein